MKLLAFVLSLCVALVIGGYVFKDKEDNPAKSSDKPVSEVKNDRGTPTFTWSYESFESEMIPRTTVSLTARYEDGTVETKPVETIEGNCNEYTEPDADVYSKSTMIICYYAGFGRYYKVVEKNGEYQVLRKEFEEASPDYEPPIANYEVLVSFKGS